MSRLEATERLGRRAERIAPVDHRRDSARLNQDRKSTRLNSSHSQISYAVFCLKKKNHYSIGTGPDHTFRTLPTATASYTVYAIGEVGDTAPYARVGPVQSLIAGDMPAVVLMLG